MNNCPQSCELNNPEHKKRVWEIDFARGLLILFVIIDHFMFDVSALGADFSSAFGQKLYIFSYEYYNAANYETLIGNLRELTRYSFVMLFVFISGISSRFSKNNLVRGLRLLSFSIIFSVCVEVISAIEPSVEPIRFNVIHVLALCTLMYAGLSALYERCSRPLFKNLFILFAGVFVIFAILSGYYFLDHPYDGAIIGGLFVTPVNKIEYIISPGDYLTLFPAAGFFLIGAFAGRKMYRDASTLFPSVNEKYLKPLTFVGRHSLFFYFGSQVLMFGTLYLLGVKAAVL